MRKFFGSIILFFALLFALIFFLLLNISYFINEGRIKNLLSESKFYDTAAFYIKDEIVKGTEFQLNEGNNFEDLNSRINAEHVTESIDTSIHGIFVALENPTPNNKVFPIRFYSSAGENSGYFFEKYINLENNKIFDLLSNKDLYMLEAVGVTLLLLAFGFLVFSGRIADKILVLGITSLVMALILLAIAISAKYFAVSYVNFIIGQSSLVQEAKLLSVVKRVSTLVVNRQVLFYLAEFIGLFIIAITAFGVRKIFLKESLQEIDKKI